MVEPQEPGGAAAATEQQFRKFIVVVDDSSESRVALRFAAHRAARARGGRLMLVHVIPPVEFIHWGGVQGVMEQEAVERAEALMAECASQVYEEFGIRPEILIRTGQGAEELVRIINEDDRIYALVLGAAKGEPGPLVDYFSGAVAGSLPCLVIVVPDALDFGRVGIG